MRMIDNIKKRLDSCMTNRINERLITRSVVRLYEWLTGKLYLRLSVLPDDKTAGCMTGQTVSHSNIKTVNHSNVQTAEKPAFQLVSRPDIITACRVVSQSVSQTNNQLYV